MYICTSFYVWIETQQGVLDITLCDKVCKLLKLAAGRWFSPGTPISSNNKTDHHEITETSFLRCLLASYEIKHIET